MLSGVKFQRSCKFPVTTEKEKPLSKHSPGKDETSLRKEEGKTLLVFSNRKHPIKKKKAEDPTIVSSTSSQLTSRSTTHSTLQGHHELAEDDGSLLLAALATAEVHEATGDHFGPPGESDGSLGR